MVQLSAELDIYLIAQRQPDTTINLMPQWAKNTLINYMWYWSRLHKAGLLCTFPTFFPDQQAGVGSLLQTEEYNFCLAHHFCWMHREKTISMKEDLIDIFLPLIIRESSNGAAKHINLSSSSRFITKMLWIKTLMNTSTSKWRDLGNIYIAVY